MTESDLSEIVRKDFLLLGYDVYPEVQDKKTKIRCDMYMIMNNINHNKYKDTILFEAKLNFNLKVLHQIMLWKEKNAAHEYFILIPMSYKKTKERKFHRELCKAMGIGLMEFDVRNNKYIISVKPEYYSNPTIPPLYIEQKQVKASNANSSYMTEFKATVQHIDSYMLNKNEVPLIDLVKNIKHHYKSDLRAIRNIKTYIETMVIKNYYITKKNRIIVVNKNESRF